MRRLREAIAAEPYRIGPRMSKLRRLLAKLDPSATSIRRLKPDPSWWPQKAETALITGIEAGQTYFNIHTMNNPGGEIRGQLVPEPASLLLLGSALLGFGLIRRRKTWRR